MRIIVTIVLLLVALGVFAQIEPVYQQYQFNQLLFNPAYAGLQERMSFSLNSRYQWAGLEGAPMTNTLSGYTSVGQSAGFGAVLVDDRLGIRRNTDFTVSGAYFINYGVSRIGMGLQASIENHRFNLDGLDPQVLNDPQLNFSAETNTKPNFGVGVMYKNPFGYIGLSIPKLLETFSEADGKTQFRTYYLSAGYVEQIPGPVNFKVSTLIRMTNKSIVADLSGALIIKEYLIGGLTLRNFNSLSVDASILVTDQLRFGYSYQLPSDKMMASTTGTHEIMIAYDLARLLDQNIGKRFF